MWPKSWLSPLRAVWDVAGQPTETLWWPAKSTKNKVVMFFVPGNPGLVEYYTEFLQTISNALPSLEIYGVSHLGHSLGHHSDLNPGDIKVYSLQDQINHKIACFDKLQAGNAADTRFILMGHSVGSYICAEVLKARPCSGISRLVALFPTLREIALTPNGVSISRLISMVPTGILATAASSLALIPAPLRSALTGLVTGQKGPCLTVTAHQLLHGSIIRNVIGMAQYEMETIKELDNDFYTAHVDKFIIYYSRNDQWAPLDHYDYMKNQFPSANVLLCEENLPHAFVLDSDHANYMADKVCQWIQDEVP